jgi:hypothetical protein
MNWPLTAPEQIIAVSTEESTVGREDAIHPVVSARNCPIYVELSRLEAASTVYAVKRPGFRPSYHRAMANGWASHLHAAEQE